MARITVSTDVILGNQRDLGVPSHLGTSLRPRRLASPEHPHIGMWVSGSTASRYLSTLRSMLAFAFADGRVTRNVAAMVKPSKAGRARPQGQFLALEELEALAIACNGPYADVVRVLGLCGLRWGELAGLQVGDRVKVPGEGLRPERTVLASSSKGGLYSTR
ncbi:hypothetical protein [Terrabacter sp. 2YAF2]|uniref:hypothetical protein n=1 Tax=Terrabacter sp. 2YAF2 TaxID=3233026 RepID=UPI003F9B0432